MVSHKVEFDEIPLKKEVVNKIKSAGGEVFLVGGACRDMIMGRKPADFDFSVKGITEQKFKEIFPGAQKVGQKFPVFKLEGHDFSLLRSEKSLVSNLCDRDFTLNALAVKLPDTEIIDPCGANKDIARGRINALPGAFRADPLRIYRGVRLVCELSSDEKKFYITPSTERQMYENKGGLGNVSPERVFVELRRALNSCYPEKFFRILARTGILKIHFPELKELPGDLFKQTMLALVAAVEETDKELVRFAVLVHDLGKKSAPKGKLSSHQGHKERSLEPLNRLVTRLKLPKNWKRAGQLAILEHDTALCWQQLKPEKLLALLSRVFRSPLGLEGFEKVLICDARSKGWSVNPGLAKLGKKMFHEVSGKNLEGISEGPEFGQVLKKRRIEWIKERLPES
ncbi:MAG: CCA tRNA nucleotidyltransferase [Bacillota bacterium]